MSIRRTSQDCGQPSDLYSNPFLWQRDLDLELGNSHEEGRFPSDDFLGDYNQRIQQVFNMDTDDEAYGSNYQEFSEAASGQTFVSTDTVESLLLGETSSGGAANWQSPLENEEVASDVGPPMGAQEMELENPTPSTSGTVAGPERQKRKREERGECDECEAVFERKSDAKRHKQAVHEKKSFACKQCNKTCSRKDALRRHMKAQHDAQLEDD